jgi:hypothetical protein
MPEWTHLRAPANHLRIEGLGPLHVRGGELVPRKRPCELRRERDENRQGAGHGCFLPFKSPVRLWAIDRLNRSQISAVSFV